MEILFDTANLRDIEEMTPLYPVAGVTTNPTIIKAEGRIDFHNPLPPDPRDHRPRPAPTSSRSAAGEVQPGHC